MTKIGIVHLFHDFTEQTFFSNFFLILWLTQNHKTFQNFISQTFYLNSTPLKFSLHSLVFLRAAFEEVHSWSWQFLFPIMKWKPCCWADFGSLDFTLREKLEIAFSVLVWQTGHKKEQSIIIKAGKIRPPTSSFLINTETKDKKIYLGKIPENSNLTSFCCYYGHYNENCSSTEPLFNLTVNQWQSRYGK